MKFQDQVADKKLLASALIAEKLKSLSWERDLKNMLEEQLAKSPAHSMIQYQLNDVNTNIELLQKEIEALKLIQQAQESI